MPKDTNRPGSARAGGARLRVRMYRAGLGDCFLLTFDPDAPAADRSHVLVDMGTIATGIGAKMDDIVKDVVATTGGRLRAVVATHEHEDHLSGFRKLPKDRVQVDEVWAAWTEDRDDPDAQALERHRGDLFAAMAAAGARLDAAAGPAAAGVARGVRELLGFSGLAEEEPLAAAEGLKARVNAAMNLALGLAPPERRVFCSPGDILQRSWAPGVRVYVLGPPRDPAALRTMGEHGSPDLYELAAAAGVELPRPAALGEEGDLQLPFDARHVLDGADPALRDIASRYALEPWRSIEHDAVLGAADLALQLDSTTNNTSLVLAFEVDGRVLLFPGDAQLGSWRSWHDVVFRVHDGGAMRRVTAEEILGRTVFYKVGHHASHNATATEKGLELMDDPRLTAFIPVDGAAAERKGWTMPAPSLYARLRDRTQGRVVRSDDGAAQDELYVDFLLPALGPSAAPPRARPDAARRSGADAGPGAGVNAADPDRLPRRRPRAKPREPRRPNRR